MEIEDTKNSIWKKFSQFFNFFNFTNFIFSVKIYGEALIFTLNEFYLIICGYRKIFKNKLRIDNQVVVITGGNAGLGKATAIEMSRRGAKIIIGCRNLEKGMLSILEIRERYPAAKLSLFKLDLASLRSVRHFANSIIKQEIQINILVNNAGVALCPELKTTDGFEMHLGTNHLGPFMLTMLLLPLLKKAQSARVITVSGSCHLIGKIHCDNINLKGAYGPLKANAQSKLANILFTRELAKRLGPKSIVHTYSIHPGWVNTEGIHKIFDVSLFKFFLLTAEQGAQTTIYCAISDKIKDESGQFYENCGNLQKMIPMVKDDETARNLWDLSNNMVELEKNSRL